MENTNQNTMETNQEQQAPVQVTALPAQSQSEAGSHNGATTEPQRKKKNGLKILIFTLLAVLMCAVGLYGYKNPSLFKASINELVTYAPQPNTSTYLYIPDYSAGINDAGTIALRTRNTGDIAFSSEYIVSMSFKIKYTPVDAISFNANSLVFDTTNANPLNRTLFTQADLKSVDTSTPGEVKISFFSNEVPPPHITGVDDQALVKLNVSLNGISGSSVDFTVEDVEVIKANYAVGPPATVSNYAISSMFNKIGAGQINFVTQNELQIVNAQVLDNTHVLVRYNDYLQVIDNPLSPAPSDYAITNPTAPLGVLAVASGYPTYDQSTVIITTTAHLLNKEYTLTVTPGNVTGNTKGGLDSSYTKAYFKNYLNPDGVINSAVLLDSVTVSSSTQLQLDFSGNLNPTTVTPINLSIKDVAGNSLTVTNVAMSSSGNDKIDVTTFLVWFVENYPQSVKVMKENPDYQHRSK